MEDRYGPRELSVKELEICRLVAQGLKNREIGDIVGTTEHVAKNYLRVIYDKLGLWNRTELALWYVKNVEYASTEPIAAARPASPAVDPARGGPDGGGSVQE